MRVPCVMWGPGRVASGKVCSELVTAMDLYPTFAQLAGARLPPDHVFDGRDITPLVEGKPGAKSPHKAFFYHGNFGELAAVRAGNWKLHLNPTPALYNLESDIGEQNDVSRRHPDVVARLRNLVIEFQEEMEQARAAGGTGPSSSREALE